MRLEAKDLLNTGSLKIKSLIYLNGAKQQEVVVADSDLGFVERICGDNNGKNLAGDRGSCVQITVTVLSTQ